MFEYYPDKLIKGKHKNPYQYKETKDWKIGQSYDNTISTETIVCSICGGVEFNVGSGTYFTGIRCVKCKYEICVHDG